MNGRLDWNKSDAQVLAEHNLQTGGEVQKYIDSSVIRYCEPYLPYDTGTLARSANTATAVGSGEVRYETPYARYQYYGNAMGPNIPIKQGNEIVGFFSPPNQIKHLTGAKLAYNTEHSPLSGSFWFERAMADHKNDILEEVCQRFGCKHD